MNKEGKPLILIVDDAKDFRIIMSAKLMAEGFAVEDAESGEAGIKKATELLPDLILLDVEMPKMNGIQTLSALKADPKTANLKVAFLTNYGESDNGADIDRKFAREIGALDHIRKTDDLSSIVEKVRSLLG
jgi:CheY-like chemotaxis protein